MKSFAIDGVTSRRIGRVVFIIVALMMLTQANATDFFVNVGGSQLVFSPQTLTIDPGDSVLFINKGGFHNVVADDNSFRCARGCDGDGKGGSGNASNGAWVARVTFNQSGTMGYFCEVHGMPGAGMFGTINVRGSAPVATPVLVPAANVFALLLLAAVLAAVAWGVGRRRGAGKMDQAPRKPR